MVGEFLRWWTDQLLACIPAAIRDRVAGMAPTLVASPLEAPGAQSLEITLRRGGVRKLVGTLPLDESDVAPRPLQGRFARDRAERTVVLRLPAHLMMERAVALPLAAARAPEQVIAYEMDRLTPFPLSEVFWTCSVPRIDRAQGQIVLRLSVVPRAPVAPLLTALSKVGLRPVRLEVARGTYDDVAAIPLAHPDPVQQSRHRRHQAMLMGAIVCLVVVATAVPFVRQSLALSGLEERIAALRPRVTEVETLRRRVITQAASSDAVAAERAQVGDPLAAIAAVTTILPDDTFLQELTLAQRRLLLRGHSAAAPRLIAALAADASIRNPAFAAPVTRIEGGQTDVFTIRAEWVP